MRTVNYCGLLLTLVCIAQCQHQNFHRKVERGTFWQTNIWNGSESKYGTSSPSSLFVDDDYEQDMLNGCSAAIFDPSQCTAVQSAPVQDAHVNSPRAAYKRPKTRDVINPASSLTTEMTVSFDEITLIMSSTPLTGAGTSSTPQASVPGSVPGSTTSGKKGLSYNSASLTSLFSGKGISWAYNWAAAADGPILPGAEYVAMLWGEKSINTWSASAAAAIASGTTHVLSFNEPDHAEQANMDPTVAAQTHIDYLNPLADQVSIGSPAITNGGSPMGIQWLENFFKACGAQCKVDFVAFHWYDAASNFAYFEKHMEDVISLAQRQGIEKVWLTEFGASGSKDEVAAFLRQAVDYLDGNSAVERYAYFMCSDGILVDGNAISNPIGEEYAK